MLKLILHNEKLCADGMFDDLKSTDIRITEQKLDTVNKFRYLGANVAGGGSKPEALPRMAQTTAGLAKLKTIWNDRNFSLISQFRQMRTSFISIFLYACET
ncbi:hypothetical protein PoB_004861400 [Plakobranchus ocellatus]|uniref:Uncharacterized protein n=1 Tax=Plakobranchus ocellatus TaxID=259542 RepID=A0AAV4BUP0_9GAST|nr:hypothetical protein PoB_004861400 [Plakobranchus ocellatus]